MKTTQKINHFKVVFLLCLFVLFTTSLIFASQINIALANFFKNTFNVVEQKDNLLVHFIYVGQGDSIAINLPDGKVVLIDAGPKTASTKLAKYLKENVVNGKRDNVIDYFIITHAESDHYGGAAKVLNEFNVDKVVFPTIENTGVVYEEVKSLVFGGTKCNQVIMASEAVDFGDGFKVEFLHYNPDETDRNIASTVVKVTYLNKSFLFMADATTESEEYYINNYGNKLDVDVLKVGHHGSNTSTGKNFLEKTTPDYAVVSCGIDNQYHFPTENVLTLLNDANADVLRTDLDGNILFSVSNDYDMSIICGKYTVVGEIVSYYFIVAFVDGVLGVAVCLEIFNSRKKKSKKRA